MQRDPKIPIPSQFLNSQHIICEMLGGPFCGFTTALPLEMDGFIVPSFECEIEPRPTHVYTYNRINRHQFSYQEMRFPASWGNCDEFDDIEPEELP